MLKLSLESTPECNARNSAEAVLRIFLNTGGFRTKPSLALRGPREWTSTWHRTAVSFSCANQRGGSVRAISLQPWSKVNVRAWATGF